MFFNVENERVGFQVLLTIEHRANQAMKPTMFIRRYENAPVQKLSCYGSLSKPGGYD
jgi:hypothetical protein